MQHSETGRSGGSAPGRIGCNARGCGSLGSGDSSALENISLFLIEKPASPNDAPRRLSSPTDGGAPDYDRLSTERADDPAADPPAAFGNAVRSFRQSGIHPQRSVLCALALGGDPDRYRYRQIRFDRARPWPRKTSGRSSTISPASRAARNRGLRDLKLSRRMVCGRLAAQAGPASRAMERRRTFSARGRRDGGGR